VSKDRSAARRPLSLSDVRLILASADFQRLDQGARAGDSGVADIDVFCCLGTTIRVAGSKKRFVASIVTTSLRSAGGRRGSALGE
jgi:hypothetical protein